MTQGELAAPSWQEVWAQARCLWSEENTAVWMGTPNPLFDGKCPIDSDPSDVAQVLAMILDGAHA